MLHCTCIWALRFPLWAKDIGQKSQGWGFSPVCLLMWILRAPFWLNALSHSMHLNGRSPKIRKLSHIIAFTTYKFDFTQVYSIYSSIYIHICTYNQGTDLCVWDYASVTDWVSETFSRSADTCNGRPTCPHFSCMVCGLVRIYKTHNDYWWWQYFKFINESNVTSFLHFYWARCIATYRYVHTGNIICACVHTNWTLALHSYNN